MGAIVRTDGPRERILLIGGWGVGKSTAAVAVAKMTEGQMYVIDTTYEADRNFGDVKAEIHHVETWDEYMFSARMVRQEATSDDWLVVDRIDPVWDMAQAGFSEKAFGKNIEDYFVEAKKDKSGHPFSGEYGINWSVIKRMYGAFMTEVMRFPGHVLVTSKAEAVQQPNRDGSGGDSVEVRQVFQKFGVKPAGEKNLGFMFHTVLLLNEVRQGEWTFTTIRDRQREQVSGKKMTNFVTSYLMPLAGWKLSTTEASRNTQ